MHRRFLDELGDPRNRNAQGASAIFVANKGGDVDRGAPSLAWFWEDSVAWMQTQSWVRHVLPAELVGHLVPYKEATNSDRILFGGAADDERPSVVIQGNALHQIEQVALSHTQPCWLIDSEDNTLHLTDTQVALLHRVYSPMLPGELERPSEIETATWGAFLEKIIFVPWPPERPQTSRSESVATFLPGRQRSADVLKSGLDALAFSGVDDIGIVRLFKPWNSVQRPSPISLLVALCSASCHSGSLVMLPPLNSASPSRKALIALTGAFPATGESLRGGFSVAWSFQRAKPEINEEPVVVFQPALSLLAHHELIPGCNGSLFHGISFDRTQIMRALGLPTLSIAPTPTLPVDSDDPWLSSLEPVFADLRKKVIPDPHNRMRHRAYLGFLHRQTMCALRGTAPLISGGDAFETKVQRWERGRFTTAQLAQAFVSDEVWHTLIDTDSFRQRLVARSPQSAADFLNAVLGQLSMKEMYAEPSERLVNVTGFCASLLDPREESLRQLPFELVRLLVHALHRDVGRFEACFEQSRESYGLRWSLAAVNAAFSTSLRWSYPTVEAPVSDDVPSGTLALAAIAYSSALDQSSASACLGSLHRRDPAFFTTCAGTGRWNKFLLLARLLLDYGDHERAARASAWARATDIASDDQLFILSLSRPHAALCGATFPRFVLPWEQQLHCRK